MAIDITATKAARSFSSLLDRVRYAGESFVVFRNGEVMCRIEPAAGTPRATVSDLLELLGQRRIHLDGFADDLEQTQRRQPRMPRR